MENISGIALARLKMADEVQAKDLSLFVETILYIYNWHHYLDKVDQDSLRPPSDFEPVAEEALYVSRLEIGTPNFIEFAGKIGPLINTFRLLGEIGENAQATGELIKHFKTKYNKQELWQMIKSRPAEFHKTEQERRVTQVGSAGASSPHLFERTLQHSELYTPKEISEKEKWAKEYEARLEMFKRGFIGAPEVTVYESR